MAVGFHCSLGSGNARYDAHLAMGSPSNHRPHIRGHPAASIVDDLVFHAKSDHRDDARRERRDVNENITLLRGVRFYETEAAIVDPSRHSALFSRAHLILNYLPVVRSGITTDGVRLAGGIIGGCHGCCAADGVGC
jgi:hypothetical protein